jgi:uncharacterized membrane protein SpoIIM required for sporulation
MDERGRARAFVKLATRAARGGLEALSDGEVLELLEGHRWAVGRLASPELPLELRSTLNAGVIKTHGLLHRSTAQSPAAGKALRGLGRGLGISTAVFFGAAAVAAAVVAMDPVLAFALAPRALLAQLDANAWGSRGATAADVGMMFFYWGNNLRVAFFALGLGVLGGLPAMLAIGFNGAMLGALGAAAASRGVEDRLLAWIAPHAVPELGGAILCGAIGLELGRSWLEPGWRRRRDALAERGRRLLPAVLIAAALIVCAAPLEGFVAPLSLPWWADAAFPVGWAALLAALAVRALRRS